MSATFDNEGVRVHRQEVCPLCGGSALPLYEALRDRLYAAPGAWSVRRCAACAAAWLDPRPLSEEIPKLYTQYFTKPHTAGALRAPAEGRAGGGSLRSRIRDAVLAHRLGYASTPSPFAGRCLSAFRPLADIALGSVGWLPAHPNGRLLDVGCGNGEFLERMREHGWNVEGVEPDAAAAQLARTERGLRVHTGDLATTSLAPESFDAVTLNHVVEHVLDPAGLVRQALHLLRDGGRLVIVTPNLDSRGHRVFGTAWVHLDPPRHLVLFTAATLRGVAQAAGARVLEIRTTARDARWAFAASTLVRRHGRLAGGRVEPDAALRVRALLFQLREHGESGGGEELVLAASRG